MRRALALAALVVLIVILALHHISTTASDRAALKESCRIAGRRCAEKCCHTACEEGTVGCLEHLDEEAPREWQPADAFYDGCTDACGDDDEDYDEDRCVSACYAGQSAAACASGERLAKYGTITQCP